VDVYLKLLAFLRPYRGRLAVAVLATILFAGATSLYAFLLGPLLKVLLTGQSTSRTGVPFIDLIPPDKLLLALPLLLVGAAVLRSGSQAAQGFLMQSTGQRIVSELRRALYARVLTLPQSWLGGSHSGDLMSRFGSDVQAVEQALTVAFASYVKDTIEAVALLCVCAWLDLKLLAAALIAVPIAAVPIVRFTRRLKQVSDEGQDALGTISSQVGEGIANARVVQAFCREEDELRKLDRSQDRYLGLMRVSFLMRASFTPVLELLGVFGLSAALYLAGSAIAVDKFAGEKLLSFLSALMLMYQPIKSLSITGQQVIQGIAGGRRIFEVLDAPVTLPDPAEPLPAVFEREVAFHQLSFSYAGPEGARVLDGIDLRLPKGRTLALVGESGAGKSTLGLLLLRFWDPTEGAVELDGVDVRRMRLPELRRLIAYVPQEPVLFSGTVLDNVACGREGASEAEVVAAIKAACAWDFVEQMGGLQAPIGERGAGLSGGQRQRLALARAFVADAPIILLDEATSALDSASEQLVQQGLERLLQGRTALVIAHRLTTIERADEIALLANGHVAERGTHRELLSRDGAYAALWAAQQGGTKVGEAAGSRDLDRSA
jgi:subfamily B ATP-binding cassette protein MsbA